MKYRLEYSELAKWWNGRFWVINIVTIAYVLIDVAIQKYVYPFLAEVFVIPLVFMFLVGINFIYFISIHIILFVYKDKTNKGILKKMNLVIIFFVLFLLLTNSVKQHVYLKKSIIENEYMIEKKKQIKLD